MSRVACCSLMLVVAVLVAANLPAQDPPATPTNDAPAAEPQAAPADEKKAADEAPQEDQPAAPKPEPAKPADDEPADEKPTAEKPATEAPATEKPAAEQPAAPDPHADDRAAIEKAVAAYIEAFNRGDAAAVAALWSPEGQWIGVDGVLVKGQAAIQASMEAYFATGEQPQLEILEPSIRFLADTVAVEEGRAIVRKPSELPSETSYTALHVKTADGWRLDSIRETEIPAPPSNFEYLRELDWMVGTWVDATAGAEVTTTCRWSKNRNFLIRIFAATAGEEVSAQGTQVIGYDAARGTIRSWLFDVDGSFGEATWSRDGDRWIISASQTLQDGSLASAVNILTPVDPNQFTWQSINRQVAGELLPDVGPITVVRAE